MRLTTALGRALHAHPPRTVTEVIREFPSIGDLAAWYSGTDDKTSRPYLAARRRFERYKAGTRKPSPAELKRIRGRLVRRTRRIRSRGATVVLDAVITVSPEGKRPDSRRRVIHGELSGGAVDELWDAWKLDHQDAADLFQELFGDENLGGQLPSIGDVTELTFTPL